jgi:hypothetical protein
MVPIDSASVQWNHETVGPSNRKSAAYTRTLALAAESVGGVQPLAKRLKVEQAALEGWIAGEAFPPHEAFLQALDIVAGGPRVDPAANRVRESAERMQAAAEFAQAQAELVRARKARANPEQSASGQFRQVQPRDGAPASNKPAEDEKNKAKG